VSRGEVSDQHSSICVSMQISSYAIFFLQVEPRSSVPFGILGASFRSESTSEPCVVTSDRMMNPAAPSSAVGKSDDSAPQAGVKYLVVSWTTGSCS
jgi:hypothetical protein